MCPLCVGCPQMHFPSAKHKRRHKEGSFCLAAHTESKREVVIFCCYYYCFRGPSDKEVQSFKCLLVQMLPIIHHQCPATLKWQRWLSHMMQLSSPCWILETISLEKLTWWFSSRVCVLWLLPRRAVTLTNCHPEMELRHSALWKNKVRHAGDSHELWIIRIS